MAGSPQEVFSDRYEPVRLVARGGMAEVWLANDALLDRVVALKVLFPELSVDRMFVERFRREAQAAANLSHPNIVSVYDWGETTGSSYFIVMEYVDGPPLSALLRDESPLLADRAAAIGADVAAALGYAHRNGVIHRDVKPGNVLITAHDQIKVTDFGIARAANTTDHLTQTGAVMGTATYFSPEQAQGLAVDQRSDVYALGVVLYEMVAGRPPFVADGPVAVAYKHVHEDVLPPSSIIPEIPEAFENVVLQALAKDVSDRYASAEELRADLLRFRQGRPVLAEPPRPSVGRHAIGAVARTARVTGPGGLLGEQAGSVARDAAVAAPAGGTALAGGAAGGPSAAAGAVGAVGAVGVAGAAGAVAGAVGLAGGAGRTTGPGAGGHVGAGPGGGGRGPDVTRVVAAQPPSGGATSARAGTAVATAGPDVADEGSPSLRIYVILLVILAAALALMVFLLNRQLNIFGASDTVTATKTPATVPVAVPSDLVGKAYTDALNEAQHVGMSVTRLDITDAQVPVNHVISTKPAAGQQVAPGSALEIDVSSGPAPLTLPDVVGEDAQAAAQQIQQAGFTVGPQQPQSSGTIAAGQVITTNPSPGYEGHTGDAITLVVSSGPGKVAVPSETGKTQAAATAELTQAGFRVEVGQAVGSVTVPPGSVVQTNPPAGTTALQGTYIALEISSGPAKVRVPYVLNFTEGNARADIQARGLVVAEVTQSVPDSSQNGVVLDETPGAGVTVDQGSTITITIGQYQASPTSAP